MVNATELTLNTLALVDDGTARLYAGPLTEVTLWRNERTGRMEHAQPGDYIVQDTDGFARRFSAADFAALWEAAPTPVAVTGASVTAQDAVSITLGWTDNVAVDDVRVYRDDVLIATVAGGVQTYVDDTPALTPDTAYSYVLRTVNSYGQESADVALPDFTLPSAPTTLVATILGVDAASLTWVNTHETAGIQPYVDGVAFGSELPAGTTQVNVTGLTTATQYDFTVRHVGAVSTLESADSNTETKTTS